MTIEEPDPLDPEGSTSPTRPSWWTAGAQVRQFGVGGAGTLAPPPTIVPALANPPEAMVTAADAVLTRPVITSSDHQTYFPGT